MNTQKESLSNLISEGEQVLSLNNILSGVEPKYVPKQAFEAWMGKINTFNERHLKDHPMYRGIFTCYFHRKNTPSNCYEMIGLLQSVESDDEFWNVANRRPCIDSRSGIQMNQNKRIFISHRTTDAAVADIVRDFIVGLGVSTETVFCSSLPGNDVKEKISIEVKEALQNSCLNIVILSKAYYESAYCLNEAGILWYNDTKVFPIGLSDIQPSDMIGFLGDDYKLRRLDSDDDIAYFADLLVEVGALTSVKSATVFAQGHKTKSKYSSIPASVGTKSSVALSLLGIQENGKLSPTAHFQELVLQSKNNVASMVGEIKDLYAAIHQIEIEDIAPVVKGWLPNQPVELPDGLKTVITRMAANLEITLSPGFFFLGSLSKPFNAVPDLFSPPNLDGTPEEKNKYNLINKLYRAIDELLLWLPVENGFKDIMCIKLALSNSGTTPDEDIDVSLQIPKDAFLTIGELPTLKEETMRFIVEDCNLSTLLGIASTAEYIEYDATIQATPHPRSFSGTASIWDQTDYEEEYKEELKDALCYDVYEDGSKYILKVKFDYLKHNTKAAFPAAIMLKKNCGSIPYEIKSKSSAQIITGTIEVE